jgi:methylenetetrahydrofolate dehydrogenase (NADP+) / methenyltetrahydrofolate cyclohydrolase
MLIPTAQIIESIKIELKSRVDILKNHGVTPKLCTVLIGESKEQESFVAIKKRVGESLGAQFEFNHLPQGTDETTLQAFLDQKVQEPTINGIIVQEPLPAHIEGKNMYAHISAIKEIEHHRDDSPFLPPIGLAALTGLLATTGQTTKSYILAEKEYTLLKEFVINKSIIVLGAGPTGGAPVYKTLQYLNIPCQVVTSKTVGAQSLLQQADIIISAVGKIVITNSNIKKGVILLNLGLHHDEKRLVGDYYEDIIQDTASWHTKTPGGLGPIDVLYLYSNLINAAAIQHNITL